MSCASFAGLVDYWFGDLAPGEEAAFEEHLFGCERCTERLAELAQLGAGVRAAFRGGAVRAVLPRAFVEALKAQGLKLREYRVAAGASVTCTIGAGDDFVIGRLQAPLAGVERVDLVVVGEAGEVQATFEDIPFDPQAGEVLLCPSPAALRRRPPHTDRFRLVALGEGGGRALGEYTFVHTPA